MAILLKRVIKIILGSVILMFCLMQTVHTAKAVLYPADKWEKNQTWTWSYDEASKTLEFTGSGDIYTGVALEDAWDDNLLPWSHLMDKAEHLVIHEGITGVGVSCFARFSQLESISLPSTLTQIDEYAFEAASSGGSVTSINFPPNLKTIEYRAFIGQSQITSITLPNGLEKIEWEAFRECSSLTEIVIPDTVREMEHGIFKYCYSLEKVVFPKGITEIPKEMFSYCNLKSIEIPATVKKIGVDAFRRCKNLCEIKMSDGIFMIEAGAFAETAITEIAFPDTVKLLGGGAVAECYHLKKVKLPSRLTTIRGMLFWECKNLKQIEIPKTVKYVRMNAFWGTGMTKVVLPKSVVSIVQEGYDSRCLNDKEYRRYGYLDFDGDYHASYESFYRTRKVKLKKLRQIVIQSSRLERISKGAFSGMKKTCVIKVPKKKVKKYKKMIYKSGVNKKVKVKALSPDR